MLRLVVLSLLVGASLWFEQSTFLPFATDQTINYSLFTPSIWRLVADVLLVAVVLGGLCLVLEHTLLIDTYSDRLTFGSSELFTPLALAASNLLSAGLLNESLRDWWPPVAYFGDSLHRLLWCAAVALVARNVYAAGGSSWKEAIVDRWTRLGPSRQSLLIDVTIAASLAAFVIATSPKIRFSGVPVGDEPKYLRYAENWWQGRGMDMEGVEDASAIPASKRGPRFLRNFSTLAPALRRDVPQLVADVSYLGNAKHWGHRFNKATYVGNWFVTGKNGGLYQIHQPGISIVILPAYAIDRWLFDRGKGRFADDLFAVNTVMLLIFLVLAGVTFRMVDRVIRHRGLSALTTGACLAALPLSSFVFQFYPETLAAVLVAAVVSQIVSGNQPTLARAGAIGIALGWLVWLQVRFAVVAATLFVWVLWSMRRDRRLWVPTVAFSGAVVAMFCLYVYHVTGSALPSALYDATPDPGFRSSRLPMGMLGVLFDRENGLFALAPLFLLALPGLGVMLRDHRQTALMLLTLFAALLVPVAGHGYETSGTSPLRHMVAVVPLVAVPVGVLLQTVRGRPMGSALAVVLLLISVQMAAAYNLRNDKTITQTIADGVSGWDPSLLFPLMRRTVQPGFDKQALMVWEIGSLAGIAAGAWFGARRYEAGTSIARPQTLPWAASLAVVPLAGLLAIAAGGPIRELRLLKAPQQAAREWQAAQRLPHGIQIRKP